MSKHLFVTSDLHLGGEEGSQMCDAAGTARLGRFVDAVADEQRRTGGAHLVLAGDVVDFLSEAPFSPFTASDHEAEAKLSRVMTRTAPFWDALAGLLAAGGQLTIQLGNHDVELSLPRPRRLLLERLGPGCVEFLYDNQALRVGPVLIEHGNRYDEWNAVDHDLLRQVRSALSRGEEPPPFVPMPGSELVVRYLNPLKAKYSFVDLLKPEDAAVPPLLAVLEPSACSDLQRLFGLVRQGARARLRRGLSPGTRSLDDLEPQGSATGREEELSRLVVALGAEAAEDEEGSRGALTDFVGLWQAARASDAKRERVLSRLYRALRAYAGQDQRAFDLMHEEAPYLEAAAQAMAAGAEVVIYGHTHLAKRVQMGNGRYLNTGTWADLMRLPRAVFDEHVAEDVAIEELSAFAEDLAQNRLERWRRQLPTFARVDLGEDLRLIDADIYVFHGPSPPTRIGSDDFEFQST